MKSENKKVYTIIISIAAFLVGIISIKQASAFLRSKDILNEDNIMKLSYEIIETANSNFDLQEELNRLRIKNDSFSFDIKDKNRIKEDLDTKINNYKEANGFNDVSGRGIDIKIEGSMVTEEIVDLINGIRNTKPTAIGVNGQRVIYRSYFIVNKDGKLEIDGNTFDFPVVVSIVGDPDVLRKSLDRSGGILDILKKNSFDKINFTVENKDSISIPAYSGKIDFKYAKTVSY